MDILNFISWIKGKRVVTTVDTAKTLMPLGLKDERRDDGYIAGAVTVEDFVAQITAPVIDANGNTIIDDTSNNIVSIPAGVLPVDFVQSVPDFSGMLIINDHYDGRVETWIAGGGDTLLLGATNLGGGPCGSTLTMNGGAYDWANLDGLNGPFTFTLIKTREEV